MAFLGSALGARIRARTYKSAIGQNRSFYGLPNKGEAILFGKFLLIVLALSAWLAAS
jgi:hypothetical protein